MTKMTVPTSGVNVRMYNTGFGDCFLMAFPKRDGTPFYMMIDCGVHGQYKGGSNRIKRVVQNIREAIGDCLDLVVVTHEHSDHVSGFYLARKTFEAMHIERAWLAWTEDPENPQAKRLDRKKSLMLKGITAAKNALAADGNMKMTESLEELLGFYEAFRISTRKSRDKITEYAKKKPPKYLEPKKEPEELPDVDGVRIFVLGPPRDEEFLLRAHPSKRRPEVYHDDDHGLHMRSEDALAAALAAAESPQKDMGIAERCMPFAGNHRISIEQVRSRPDLHTFYHKHYGFDSDDEAAWRRIDMDWQQAADSLALALDSATNNTSLVLAIELVHSGKVLLFTGDAQVGNWLSWHKGSWMKSAEVVTAKDLLRRTVLYKGGHHGSHNATLKEMGLEMMTSPDFMAMLPVDEAWARGRTHPWKMPFEPMYEDLKARTKGRILRADIGMVAPESWASYAKKPTVVEGDDGSVLYVELEIQDL